MKEWRWRKSKSQLEQNLADRVKLRRQKVCDEDLSDTSSLEGDDSDKFIDVLDIPPLEGKGLKVLTRKKLLTRLPILLAQIKTGITHTN